MLACDFGVIAQLGAHVEAQDLKDWAEQQIFTIKGEGVMPGVTLSPNYIAIATERAVSPDLSTQRTTPTTSLYLSLLIGTTNRVKLSRVI